MILTFVMTSIRLHLYSKLKFKNRCNCIQHHIFKFKQEDITQTKTIALKCSYHFSPDLIFNVDFKDVYGEQATDIKNINSIIISQNIKQVTKKEIEYEHHKYWKNIKYKREEEIRNLENDRSKIFIKLSTESENLEAVSENKNINDLCKEIELIGKQIKHHKQEIDDIINSSCELEYKELCYINSSELLCSEYNKCIICSNKSWNILDIEQKYNAIWNFHEKKYENLDDKYKSIKRKDISQQIHKIILPKLSKYDCY